ncbi:MAG: ASKHA domain-containing protein [Desulfotomaculales bacterium]
MEKKKEIIVLAGRAAEEELPADPLTRKIFLKLPPPGENDNLGDVDRLCRVLAAEIGKITVPLELMRIIPSLCREAGWIVTATVGWDNSGFRLVDLEAGNRVDRHFGLAVDLGTTTVVAYLVNLQTGRTAGVAAGINEQVKAGEDILTRICLGSSPEGLSFLQKAAVETINSLIAELEEKTNVKGLEISALTVGANTAMTHFLLGLDPSRLCLAPYTPVANRPGFLSAQALGIGINPRAVVYCLPSVGSYLGGDVVGGILTSGMHLKSELALFVDIGTNGEIVLGNREWLVGCAGAAGPALEGGVAGSGRPAGPGTIASVKIDPETGEVHYETIGGLPPVGICGSGLVDCLAELFLNGIIDRAGKFKKGDRFVIVPAGKSATGEEIAVTQTDIDNLLRTKGAVSAALELLLENVGCELSQIERFYAAGAFGQFLNLESAVTVGLFPDLARDRMVRLGNSSGEGARRVLLSARRRLEAEEIAAKITYIELNARQDFMHKFISSRFLPHTNLDYFPSVKRELARRRNASFA